MLSAVASPTPHTNNNDVNCKITIDASASVPPIGITKEKTMIVNNIQTGNIAAYHHDDVIAQK